MRLRSWVVCSLLFLITLGIYSNTFSVPFHFDDHSNIVENPEIKNPSSFLSLSGTRDIGFLSFALNYAVGGLNVFGYHAVNLAIHILNGFLVYALVLFLLQASGRRDKWIAVICALFFLVHPVQTQAVTYIVQRFASLVTLFYLAAIVCYLKWRLGDNSPLPPSYSKRGENQVPGRGWVWYAASLISTVLAMKTKENSFTLPLMIGLIEWIFFRKRWLAIIPFLATLFIIPLSTMNALGEAEGFARDSVEISRLDYLFTQFRVILTYLRLLILPFNQTLDYDYPIYHSFWVPAVFFSFLFLFSLFGLAFRLLLRRGDLLAFGILWFFITLSVESSIIPIKDVIFEHRLYLPAVGFFLAISEGASRASKVRQMPLILGGLALLLAILSYQRNLVWQNPVTLWKDVTEKAPTKARGHYGLGKAYQVLDITAESIQAYRQAIALRPDYLDAWINLGVLYKKNGLFKESLEAYQAALKIAPDSPQVHNNLGSLYASLGQPLESIQEYQEALRLKPDFVEARYNLGRNYLRLGRVIEAKQEWEHVLTLQPGFTPARKALEDLKSTF